MWGDTGLLVSRLDLSMAGFRRQLFAAQLIAAAVPLLTAAAAGRSAALRATAAASGTPARRSLLAAANKHPAVLARRMMVPVVAAERRFRRIVHHEVLIAALAVAGLAVSTSSARSLRLFVLRRRDAALGHSIAEIARAERAPLRKKYKYINSPSNHSRQVHSPLPTAHCILNTGLEGDMIGFVDDGVSGGGGGGGAPNLARADGRVPIAIIVSVFGVCEWRWGGDC